MSLIISITEIKSIKIVYFEHLHNLCTLIIVVALKLEGCGIPRSMGHAFLLIDKDGLLLHLNFFLKYHPCIHHILKRVLTHVELLLQGIYRLRKINNFPDEAEKKV